VNLRVIALIVGCLCFMLLFEHFARVIEEAQGAYIIAVLFWGAATIFLFTGEEK
jgi:hypothetical protein